MVNVSSGDAVEAKAKQSAASKRATLDKLKSKKQKQREFSIFVDGEELTLLFRAIGAAEYDKLVSKYPPTKEQLAEGASFNINTFAPALIAEVCVEPKMTYEDMKGIWDSTDWSRGDLMTLFSNAVDINNIGFDIPFSERG